MKRFVRVRGADPDLVIAGGVLWLVAIPAFGLAALALFHPFRSFGDCFDHCVPPPTVLEAVGPPAIIWLVATAGLLGLAWVTRRRPIIGHIAFALIGIAILLLIGVVVVQAGQPILGVILLGWPGWSGIAFVNAAWRSRAEGRSNANAS